MKWQKLQLDAVADFRLGKMLDEKKNKGDLMPYLANVNVRWGEFNLSDLREMRFEDHEHNTFGLRYGDIVMCEGGEPGRCAIWKEQLPGTMIQKALHRIRPHKCLDHAFLFYTFLHMGKTGQFSPLFTGATIKHLPREKLALLEIAVPPLAVQKSIANVLSAYDDLIENNTRRIALLEQAVRLLYEEWFVRLRFPGRERTKSVNGLPQGWRRAQYSEVVDYLEGPGLRNWQYREGGIPFLNIRTIQNDDIDFSKVQYLDEGEVEARYQHFLLAEDDHVVSSSGTLGRVATVRACHLPVMLNTSIIRMRPNAPMTKWFLKAFLKYGNYLDQVTAMATGAAQLNYGPSHLDRLEIVIPPRSLITLFDEHAAPIYQQIKILLDCSHKLQAARDLLLPRLMSGEIVV